MNEQEIMQLAFERAKTTEFAVAVGNFLVEARWKCPKLKAIAETAFDSALAMISHHTNKIKQLKETTK
jgi:hypothetical protein